ncbi:MarR family winged helix-turn-helix transcriptional regulator [Pseudofrankia asymbiotica]|uniref:MarR family winged helix-turn-helix transcriptional regulator n=1 Tax=Pseudofrankia asymbiotica TaxID=1834516 RepID=UPI001F529E7A|nr:MarR family transcriptional regulator [Pseudofrankia asymbiotica]
MLTKLAALARQQCAEQLTAAGLSQHQHAILCCLDEYGPAFQKDIAARLDIDSGDIVAFIDGLQDQGLVIRERDRRDRRRQILTITRNGKKALRHVERTLDNTEPGVLTALTPDQRDVLHRTALLILARHDPGAWRDPSASAPTAEPDPPLDGSDELRPVENTPVALR